MKFNNLNLRQCLIFCDRGTRWLKVPLSESPFFKSLVAGINSTKSKRIYNQYLSKLKVTSYDKETSWFPYIKIIDYQGFLFLYEDIKNKGFDYNLKPKVRFEEDDNLVIADGQHRLAILLFLELNEMLEWINIDKNILYNTNFIDRGLVISMKEF